MGVKDCFGKIMIRMDVRISRISPIRTDFFYFLLGFRAGIPKNPYEFVKSVKSVHLFVSQLSQSVT
ncbi:MAG: hypothetical protein RLZZ628_2508 [Bacteroidota bacterium]|jgi:hypothetical protein